MKCKIIIKIFSPYAGTGRGMFGGDDAIIYWKCEAGITLKEVLKIPITNAARERALMLASQQVIALFFLLQYQHYLHVSVSLRECTIAVTV